MFVNPHGSMGGYQIPNSVRLRASASAYFSRTFGAPTSNTTWSFSLWHKKAAAAGSFLDANTSGVYFDAAALISLKKAGAVQAASSAVFRDTSAHAHVFVRSNGTDVKVYWNSVEVASYTGTIPDLNSAIAHNIGRSTDATRYFDGYLSDVYFIDGQALTPSSFGQTDSNGVWVPKAYTGTYGNNGFHLDFKDANLTAGSNVGLGKDVSGNGNYWNTNNISVTAGVTYDSMVDTPTNNYATLNPLAHRNATVASTLSEASLKATQTGGVGDEAVFSTIVLQSGKWYYEVLITSIGSGVYPGFTDSNLSAQNSVWTDSFYFLSTDGKPYVNNVAGSLWATFTTNDIIGFELDIDAGTCAVYKGASLQGTATGITVSGKSPVCGLKQSSSVQFNFGQRPFNRTPNSGFKAICTANLPAVAIPKPSNGFKATLDTATNIDASVAAARSGWPAYVDIKKNRSAAASWQWQFSHDSTKEYAIASASVTNQAKSSNTGANNWMGWSIRIDSAYGTAAGSVTHTNGADTTVTHNVGVSARQLIFLFPRAGGSVVRVYHPDLTAGSLLDLCSDAAEAVSATIKTVLSTSFKIDSATASGTYDYLVISELSGFFKLFYHTGNASTDGPFDSLGVSPKVAIMKSSSAIDNWIEQDFVRSAYNPTNNRLWPGLSDAEFTSSGGGSGGYDMDLLSNGIKPRTSNTGINGSGVKIVGATFASNPFGGSNISPAPAR